MKRIPPQGLIAVIALAACAGDDEAQQFNAARAESDAGFDADAVGDLGPNDADADVNALADADGGDSALFELGPNPVGFSEFEVTYQAPGVAEPRSLPVKVWYPAAENSGASAARYSVAGIVDVPTEVALDTPPAGEETYPIALYSHGFGGEGLLAYPFGEHLASWGWVVVSPNHVGNTALDAIGGFAPFASTVLHRVTDVTAVLDAVESGTTVSPIDGHADIDHVLVFGHSFGGYTTLAAGGADYQVDLLTDNCAAFDDGSCEFMAEPDVVPAFDSGFGDDRIDALVAQAPALIPELVPGELAAIDIPVMIQSGDMDATLDNDVHAEPAWNALDGGEDVWVRMPQGGHFTFLTVCYDLPENVLLAFRPDAPDDGCSERFIDARVAIPALTAYLHAFADTHVLGSQRWDDVLNGDTPLDHGFSVTTR